MRRSVNIGWTWMAAAALLVAACGGKGQKQQGEAAPADTTAAASQAASAPATTPARQPTEKAPAPKPTASKPKAAAPTGATGAAPASPSGQGQTGPQPAPQPKPSAPATVALTVASGTSLSTTLDQQLSTHDSKVGDTFTVTVARSISADGRTAIPAGAKVHGEVTAVQESGSSGQAAVLKVDFKRLTVGGKSYPITAKLLEAKPEKKSRTSVGGAAAKIGVGTAAGAILGRIIGGNATGTFIGAAVGAAAGTAIVLGTQDVDAVLPKDSPMTLQLEQPLTVRRPR